MIGRTIGINNSHNLQDIRGRVYNSKLNVITDNNYTTRQSNTKHITITTTTTTTLDNFSNEVNITFSQII